MGCWCRPSFLRRNSLRPSSAGSSLRIRNPLLRYSEGSCRPLPKRSHLLQLGGLSHRLRWEVGSSLHHLHYQGDSCLPLRREDRTDGQMVPWVAGTSSG